MAIKALESGKGHYDAYDETPCDGPYQLTGLSMQENFGIAWGPDPDTVVLRAQEKDPGTDVYHAIALDEADVR